jgi:hypothetical protein
MGLFDDLGKALKQVEEEMKKSDLDRHLKNVGEGLNKAGKEISAGVEKARSPSPQTSGQPQDSSNGRPSSRQPHPGYQKIAAWMKRNYKDRIAVSGDPYQRGIQLEQLSLEACRELPAKAKKGFLDYLKKQNYEPLLK